MGFSFAVRPSIWPHWRVSKSMWGAAADGQTEARSADTSNVRTYNIHPLALIQRDVYHWLRALVWVCLPPVCRKVGPRAVQVVPLVPAVVEAVQDEGIYCCPRGTVEQPLIVGITNQVEVTLLSFHHLGP